VLSTWTLVLDCHKPLALIIAALATGCDSSRVGVFGLGQLLSGKLEKLLSVFPRGFPFER